MSLTFISVHGGLYDRHIGRMHQPFDIDNNQHAVIDRAERLDLAGVEAGGELGRLAQLRRIELQPAGHGIDHDADNAISEIQDDGDSKGRVLDDTDSEFDPRIDA